MFAVGGGNMKKIEKRKLSNKSQKRTSQNHPYAVSPLALPFFSIIFDINYSPFKTKSKRQKAIKYLYPIVNLSLDKWKNTASVNCQCHTLLGPKQPWPRADRRGRLYCKWARQKGYHLDYKAVIKQGQAF